MSSKAVPVLLLVLLLIPGCTRESPPQEAEGGLEVEVAVPGAPTGTTAFVGVDVLPMNRNEVLRGHTVLVREGRVVRVGPSDQVEVPGDAVRVEGRGRSLLPGLSEMHAHLPGPDAPSQRVEDLLFLYLANGVTTVRTMLGAPNHLELREAVVAGDLLGPTLFVAAPSLSGNSAPDPETGEALVREHAEAGYDLLKMHPGLEGDVHDRIVEVAREVGITWAGHVSPPVGLERALAAGKSTVDHLDGYVEAAASEEVRRRASDGEVVPLREVVESATGERIRELARTTREAGTWNVPTMYLWENFYNDVPADRLSSLPEMRYATPDQLEQWREQKENRSFVELLEGWRTRGALGADDVSVEDGRRLLELRREILASLADVGAGILLGTDSPQMFMVPGFSLHHEIRVMAESGLSAFQILESGGPNVARYVREDLGHGESFGTVTEGARADLILVEGDPLEDLEVLRSPAGVMVRGRWIPAEEIQGRLDAIARRAGS